MNSRNDNEYVKQGDIGCSVWIMTIAFFIGFYFFAKDYRHTKDRLDSLIKQVEIMHPGVEKQIEKDCKKEGD